MKFDDLLKYQRTALLTVQKELNNQTNTDQRIDFNIANITFDYSLKSEHVRVDRMFIDQVDQPQIEVMISIRRKTDGSFFIASLNYSVMVWRKQTYALKCHNYLL